jgi:hypothetical protein
MMLLVWLRNWPVSADLGKEMGNELWTIERRLKDISVAFPALFIHNLIEWQIAVGRLDESCGWDLWRLRQCVKS